MANRHIIMSDEQLLLVVKGLNGLRVSELTEEEAKTAVTLRNMCRDTIRSRDSHDVVHGFVL